MRIYHDDQLVRLSGIRYASASGTALNAIEAPPRPFQGLGRSLHGAYCIAQLGVICYIKFVSARPLPCIAWELPSTLASLNAIKAPPQALEGPGEEPS